MALDILNYADNLAGAWLFAGLILFILLYLIKPKPNERVIPSLMFLYREMHTQKSNSFFQKLLRDILIFFHLLILLLMSIAAMHPYYDTTADVAAEYTVLVIDNSASMATKTGVTSRLSQAISETKDHLDGTISIILVQNSPYVVLQDGEKEDALEIVNYIPQTTALSALGSSILAADDLLGEHKGKVVVISDFINTDPLDSYIARESLETKGHRVEFINLREDADNVGIVDMQSVDEETVITIQNYNDETASVDVTINREDYHLEIAANWQEKLTFQHQEGLNNITLSPSDDFIADNEVVLSVPQRKETDVLVITNSAESYVYAVMQAYAETWNDEATIEKGEPPVMPVVDHNMIILSDVSTDNVPGAVVSKIKEAVYEGASLVVTAQDDLNALDLEDILPVTFADNPIRSQKADVEMRNVLTDVTEGVSITSIDKYMQTTAKENTMTLAATTDGTPVIAIGSYGEGTVVYYGLFESNSSFKYDVTYPLFWLQLTDYLIGKDRIETLNYKIGEKVIFDTEIPVQKPSGDEEMMEEVEFDEVGIYQYKNKLIAVNLLNRMESNVDYVNEQLEKAIEESEQKEVSTKQPLVKALIIALLVVLFLELLYVKARGDF
jgi:hypothetical protein